MLDGNQQSHDVSLREKRKQIPNLQGDIRRSLQNRQIRSIGLIDIVVVNVKFAGCSSFGARRRTDIAIQSLIACGARRSRSAP
jgi:hypothetical protein